MVGLPPDGSQHGVTHTCDRTLLKTKMADSPDGPHRADVSYGK